MPLRVEIWDISLTPASDITQIRFYGCELMVWCMVWCMPVIQHCANNFQNQMQSETADFVPGAATWRTGRNIRVVFDSGLLPPLYGNMTSEEDRTTAIGSMCRKFDDIWTCDFWAIRADRHTYRQTNRHTDTLFTKSFVPILRAK